MRLLVAVLVSSLTFGPVAWAKTPCVKQTYTDWSKPPDYDCPGPDEDAMVPRLQLKTSAALELGKKAPFAGILLDKNRVLTLGLRIKALRRLRYLQMKSAAEKLAAERELLKASHKATLDLRTSQRDNYKSQTVALQKEVIRLNKWYRSPALWFAIGFVTAAAGATALGIALRK